MRLDLTAAHNDGEAPSPGGQEASDVSSGMRRWIAHPRTLRLTTRPRPSRNPDGSRSRTFNRVSRSCAMPSFVFNFSNAIEALAARLLTETLIPLFHQLHPEKSGWDLSLINLCATNMSQTGTDSKASSGRDIGRMFRRQEEALKDWKIEDIDVPPSPKSVEAVRGGTTSPRLDQRQSDESGRSHSAGLMLQGTDDEWNRDDDFADLGTLCQLCSAMIPSFAKVAHEQFVSYSLDHF